MSRRITDAERQLLGRRVTDAERQLIGRRVTDAERQLIGRLRVAEAAARDAVERAMRVERERNAASRAAAWTFRAETMLLDLLERARGTSS